VRKILTGTSQYAVGVPATGFQNEELLTIVSVGTVPHTDRGFLARRRRHSAGEGRASLRDDGVVMTNLSDVIAAAAATLGQPLRLRGPTARGESASTFVVAAPTGSFVLKLHVAGDEVLANQQRLVRLTDILRDRGHSTPAYRAVGEAAGQVYTLQEMAPGETLEPAPGRAPGLSTLRVLLPQLLDAIELQRDLGDLEDAPWPGWLLDTIEHGGDGYCLHTTMRQRGDTSALLDQILDLVAQLRGQPARSADLLHFDLNPANVLHHNGRVTGIVDWTVPFQGAMQGDRGFDVATLLFYYYDVDPALRSMLWQRCLDLSGLEWTAIYLCHLILRQLEWSTRHRPGSAEVTRFWGIAHAALYDITGRGAG
jgi:thiamine kinase-like enzyme